MSETYFTFRGRFIKTISLVTMGNPPLQENLEKEGIILLFWVRFVDDVHAVVKRQEVTAVLASPHNAYRKWITVFFKIMYKGGKVEFDIRSKISDT